MKLTARKPDRDNNEDSNERSQYPTWAGYTGTIYDSKNKSSNYDVMHETFHMLGFSDRYNQKTGKAFGGYENDLMGTYGAMNASYNYYKIIKSYVERHTQPPYRVYPGNVVIDKYFPQGKGNGILKY